MLLDEQGAGTLAPGPAASLPAMPSRGKPLGMAEGGS